MNHTDCRRRISQREAARASSLRGGEGTADWDTVASNCSTGNCLPYFNKRMKLEKLELNNLSSTRASNRIFPPSEPRLGANCDRSELPQGGSAEGDRRFWGMPSIYTTDVSYNCRKGQEPNRTLCELSITRMCSRTTVRGQPFASTPI